MFDTHAHINFNAYKDDGDEVIDRALAKNVGMINVGSQVSTSERAISIAQKFDNVYAAVGLHPIQLQDMQVEEEGIVFTTRQEKFDYATYRELGSQKKVMAIGEVGLDYYHISAELDRAEVIAEQKHVFQEHIKLANELQLPLIIHCRGTKENFEAVYYELLEIVKNNLPEKRGVLHCYGGPVALVKEFVDLGFYLGFNGIITFDKTGKLEQILLSTPNERILSETDCPWLTPVPHRGKRNEPSFVEFVVQKIADIKRLDFGDAEKIIDHNVKQLFAL